MTATTELLARWMARTGTTTKTAAADALGVSKQAINGWHTDERNGEANVIERMALDLGLDPVPWIIRAFAEAQRSDAARKTLHRLAKRLSGAAVVLVALGAYSAPGRSWAAQNTPENAREYTLCAVKDSGKWKP